MQSQTFSELSIGDRFRAGNESSKIIYEKISEFAAMIVSGKEEIIYPNFSNFLPVYKMGE